MSLFFGCKSRAEQNGVMVPHVHQSMHLLSAPTVLVYTEAHATNSPSEPQSSLVLVYARSNPNNGNPCVSRTIRTNEKESTLVPSGHVSISERENIIFLNENFTGNESGVSVPTLVLRSWVTGCDRVSHSHGGYYRLRKVIGSETQARGSSNASVRLFLTPLTLTPSNCFPLFFFCLLLR